MNEDRKTSQSQIDETKESEGFRETVYDDGAGNETIGYGHKVTDKEKSDETFKGKTITREEADELLKKDLERAEDCVRKNVKVPLTQGQFDALVDFVFNVGCGNFKKSTLLKLLNEGKYDKVPKELMRWTKATVDGEKVDLPGLVNRRKRNVKRWNSLEDQVCARDNSDIDRILKKTEAVERWKKLRDAEDDKKKKARFEQLIEQMMQAVEKEMKVFDNPKGGNSPSKDEENGKEKQGDDQKNGGNNDGDKKQKTDTEYVVKKGDSAWDIVRDILHKQLNRIPSNKEIGNALEKVKKANPAKDIDKLKPGDRLIIPSFD